MQQDKRKFGLHRNDAFQLRLLPNRKKKAGWWWGNKYETPDPQRHRKPLKSRYTQTSNFNKPVLIAFKKQNL